LKKVNSIIGFAQKAGKASSGTLAAKTSLIRNRAKLLVISSDISEKTGETLIKLCGKNHIPWLVYGDKIELGNCVGKAYRVAVTINDENMAATILKNYAAMGEKAKSTGVVEWQK